MTFDSNRAWQDCVSAVRANREVLFAVAGVFFLLPSLLSGIMLGDLQTKMMANIENKAVLDQLVAGNMGLMLGVGLGGLVVQSLGAFALMRLLSDRDRPTVGAALKSAVWALPSLIGVILLLLLAVVMGLSIATALAGAFAMLPGIGSLLAAAVFSAAVIAVIAVGIRVSLVVPVVVKEGQRHPVRALVRSWQLTRGNGWRLFGFFTLLTLAYFVVAMVVTMVLVAPVVLLFGQGAMSLLYAGVVSGAVSAVSSVIMIAVLASAHRQLSGDGPRDLPRIFE